MLAGQVHFEVRRVGVPDGIREVTLHRTHHRLVRTDHVRKIDGPAVDDERWILPKGDMFSPVAVTMMSAVSSDQFQRDAGPGEPVDPVSNHRSLPGRNRLRNRSPLGYGEPLLPTPGLYRGVK